MAESNQEPLIDLSSSIDTVTRPSEDELHVTEDLPNLDISSSSIEIAQSTFQEEYLRVNLPAQDHRTSQDLANQSSEHSVVDYFDDVGANSKLREWPSAK